MKTPRARSVLLLAALQVGLAVALVVILSLL